MSRSLSNVTEYCVRPGDTLSDIARRRYGTASLWPRVARFNGMKRPDLLLAGQRILLPVPETLARWAAGTVGFVTDLKPAPAVAFPAIKHSFDNLMPVTTFVGTFKVTLALKGELVFQRRGGIKDVSLTNLRKLEATAKQQVGDALHSLTYESGFSFDPEHCTLDLKLGLATVLRTPDGGALTHKVEVGFNSVKFICERQPATGHWRDLDIEGTFGYEVTVENYTPPVTQWAPAVVRESVERVAQFLEDTYRQGVYAGLFPTLVLVGLGLLVAVVLMKAPIVAMAVVAFVVAIEWLERAGGGPGI